MRVPLPLGELAGLLRRPIVGDISPAWRRGIVAIGQHCCRKASAASRSVSCRPAWGSMTSVDEVASAEPAMAAAPSRSLVRSLIGPAAVVLALLSALVTFLILAGFTPIVPTHAVVVSVLLVNVATVLILLGVI